MSARTVALLPMRHSSERVVGKNYRLFGGQPLFEHVLATLLSCDSLSEVVVDTDSPIISEALSGRDQVRVVERPNHLRAGEISMNAVIAHDLSLVDADVFLQTHATNPLLNSATVSTALETFRDRTSEYDSLFTVTRLQSRLWDERGRPMNHDPQKLERTQDMMPVFEENSCLYVFSRESFEATQNRIGHRPYLMEISPVEAVDIDTEWDFRMAEVFWREAQCAAGYQGRNQRT